VRLPPLLQIALSSVCVSAMALLARSLGASLPASELVVLRFAVGLVGLLLLFAVTGRRPVLRHPRMLLLRGVLGGATVLTYFHAIAAVGVGPATLLNYLSPIHGALFAWLFLREPIRPRLVLGLVCSALGAGLVLLGQSQAHAAFSWPGAVEGFLSGVFAGGVVTSVKRLREDTDSLSIFLAFCVVGLAVSLPLAVPQWVWPSPHGALLAVAMGLFAFASQLLWNQAIKHVPAASAGAVSFLTPAISFVVAVVVFDEVPTALTSAGALLCVAGVAIGVIRRPSR
jgi:drug/metabolite transporter (DMT)-like permease